MTNPPDPNTPKMGAEPPPQMRGETEQEYQEAKEREQQRQEVRRALGLDPDPAEMNPHGPHDIEQVLHERAENSELGTPPEAP